MAFQQNWQVIHEYDFTIYPNYDRVDKEHCDGKWNIFIQCNIIRSDS